VRCSVRLPGDQFHPAGDLNPHQTRTGRGEKGGSSSADSIDSAGYGESLAEAGGNRTQETPPSEEQLGKSESEA
jgi:hypothetical protein